MRIASVFGSLFTLALLSSPVGALAQEVLLTDDAAINSAATSTNYGGSTSITVNSTNSVLLQFDLADILPAGTTASQVSRARLILFPDKVSTAGDFDVYGVTGAWSETSVTYATRPAVSSSAGGTGTAKLGYRSTFVAVTGLVQGWISSPSSNHGFEIKASGSTNFTIDTKENTATSRPAVLQIDLIGPAGPTGPAGPAGPRGATGATGPRGPAGTVTLPYSATYSREVYPVFSITNSGSEGAALQAQGGPAPALSDGLGGVGGEGMIAVGGTGTGDGGRGGYGVEAEGGQSDNSGETTGGGTGIYAAGGSTQSAEGAGGDGADLLAGLGGYGVYAYGEVKTYGGGGTSGGAGYFDGNVEVSGNLSKSGGSFKIDDPADPADRYLYHSFVESPDMKNVYDGVTTTDASGIAIVTLPDWFEKLNRDFRYQLTTIGTFAQATVENEVSSNRFVIRTDRGGVKVSWQVTGIRQDAWANAHRIPVEVEKTSKEKGHYIHPELFGHAGEPSTEQAAHPRPLRRERPQ